MDCSTLAISFVSWRHTKRVELPVDRRHVIGDCYVESGYKENAATCLLLADQACTTHPLLRTGLIDMSHAWLQLAEQAESANEIPTVPVYSERSLFSEITRLMFTRGVFV
jgi:hypothetical protein